MRIAPICVNRQLDLNQQKYNSKNPINSYWLTRQYNFTSSTRQLESNPLLEEIFSDANIAKFCDTLIEKAGISNLRERPGIVDGLLKPKLTEWTKSVANASDKKQEFMELFISDLCNRLMPKMIRLEEDEMGLQNFTDEIRNCVKAWKDIDIEELHEMHDARLNGGRYKQRKAP